MNKVIREKQNLTHLQWSKMRFSSGTAGSFLKSQSTRQGQKYYYKLSNFDSEKGITGHECVNEIIVDRLLTILGVGHLEYQLIHSDIEIEDQPFTTWLCMSKDYKKPREAKTTLENFYQLYREPKESRYNFCVRQGWKKYVNQMLVVDFLILNRDRHGANMEVLRDSREKTIRLAPLFDHGLSFLCSCRTEEEILKFDVMDDRPCNNFIGNHSTWENLKNISMENDIFDGRLQESSREYIFKDLQEALPELLEEKIWNMLWGRWCQYENLRNHR